MKNEIETEEGIGQDFLDKNIGTSIGIKENIMPGDYGNKTLTVKSGRPIKPMTAALWDYVGGKECTGPHNSG